MKKSVIGAMVALCVAAGPAVAFAQSTPSSSKAATPATPATPAKKAATAPAVHSTTGVVKSIDSSTLVITKVAGKGPETSFIVNASTQRQGNLVAGAAVDVRYHTEGKDKIATAVSVQQPKAATTKAAAKTSTSSTTKK